MSVPHPHTLRRLLVQLDGDALDRDEWEARWKEAAAEAAGVQAAARDVAGTARVTAADGSRSPAAARDSVVTDTPVCWDISRYDGLPAFWRSSRSSWANR